jgi:hypothetical protein
MVVCDKEKCVDHCGKLVFWVSRNIFFLCRKQPPHRLGKGWRITDQLFKSNITVCIVCVFAMQTDEYVHDRLFNANLDRNTRYNFSVRCLAF